MDTLSALRKGIIFIVSSLYFIYVSSPCDFLVFQFFKCLTSVTHPKEIFGSVVQLGQFGLEVTQQKVLEM